MRKTLPGEQHQRYRLCCYFVVVVVVVVGVAAASAVVVVVVFVGAVGVAAAAAAVVVVDVVVVVGVVVGVAAAAAANTAQGHLGRGGLSTLERCRPLCVSFREVLNTALTYTTAAVCEHSLESLPRPQTS